MLKENTKKTQKTRGGLNQANLKLGMKSIHTVDVSSSINNYNSNKFTLPRIEDILDNVGRTKFCSVLDLNSGFHQVPLDEKSRSIIQMIKIVKEYSLHL